jgi:hypothetical protein
LNTKVLDEILRDDTNAEHGVDMISAINATQLWVGGLRV